MIFDKDTAKKIAALLLEIKAVKLSPNRPFTWSSGWESPVYCDNRIVLSYPFARSFIKNQLATAITGMYPDCDVIAGVATGAIGMGALTADLLQLPFVYVRPESKKHGCKNRIEGRLQKGQSVVVIEDLVSTGKSSLNAVKALREASIDVKGMLAVFSYGFNIATQNFVDAGVALTILSDYQYLLKQAVHTGYISSQEVGALKQWSENPAKWCAL